MCIIYEIYFCFGQIGVQNVLCFFFCDFTVCIFILNNVVHMILGKTDNCYLSIIIICSIYLVYCHSKNPSISKALTCISIFTVTSDTLVFIYTLSMDTWWWGAIIHTVLAERSSIASLTVTSKLVAHVGSTRPVVCTDNFITGLS